MQVKNKKIGIWGFGIVGKASAQFLYEHGAQLTVMDNRTLQPEEQQWLIDRHIPFCMQDNLHAFLAQQEYILASPGIDIRPYYQQYEHQWITELDLFMEYWQKPIIAITGSVGKTTVTSCISQLLSSAGKKICTGGNIGVGSLDLIKNRVAAEYAVLEVADVQLRYTQYFSPDLALWTNFYPNHLNWHNSLDDYFKAKSNIIAHQSADQHALVPADLLYTIQQQINPRSILHIFTPQPIPQEVFSRMHPKAFCFTIRDTSIIASTQNTHYEIGNLNQLPPITFVDNWLAIVAACYLLNMPKEQIALHAHHIHIPEHRLEKVAAIKDVLFYNDSKSTIIESTDAALKALHSKSVILFLGGLSKGVDRAPFIKTLIGRVKTIYCFGAEADTLVYHCKDIGIDARGFATLDDAFATCTQNIVAGDTVLFSPAGSSHDLFSNYQERGNRFKQLVYNHASMST